MVIVFDEIRWKYRGYVAYSVQLGNNVCVSVSMCGWRESWQYRLF